MKLTRVIVCSLAALLMAAPAAMAQDDEDLGDLVSRRPPRKAAAEEAADPARTGVYIGLGGTYAIENFDAPGGFNNGLGFNFRVGRRFHSHVAGELEIEKFSGFNGNGVEYDAWIMGLNAKGFLLTGEWQPYLLAGIGFSDGEVSGTTNDSEEGFVTRFGGGVDYYLTDNVLASVDLTYVLNIGDLKDFDAIALSWGFQYRP